MYLNKLNNTKYRIYLCFLFTILLSQYKVNAVEIINNVYQITSADDLKEFANIVNEGDSCVNAILTTDIDYRSISKTIGLKDSPYCGNFDGACHKIIFDLQDDCSHLALFKYVGRNGVLKNLFLQGEIHSNNRFAGGAVGMLKGGSIENCLINVNLIYESNNCCYFGGIVGQSFSYSNIKNSVFGGKIIAREGSCAAGLIGKIMTPGSSMTNCLSACEFELSNESGSNSIACMDHPNWLTVNETYYFTNISSTIKGAQQITQQQWISGEALFKVIGSKMYRDEREHMQKDAMFQNVLAYVGLGLLFSIIIAVILVLCLYYYQEQRHIYKLLYEGAVRNHEQWISEQQIVLEMDLPESKEDETLESIEDARNTNLQQLYINLLSKMAKEKLYTNPDLDEPTLASIMCSNKSYISECIRRYSKQSNFSSWIANYRINHAIQCIDENPDIAVKSLYIEVGFKNHTSFTRHFKNIVGMTATQYIKMKDKII